MNEKLAPLQEILKLNTRLFHNCLQDIEDAAARERFGGSANNIAFIAVHLVDARRFLGLYLGLPADQLPRELLADVQSIEDVKEYPALELLRDQWQLLSRALIERFAGLSPGDLNAVSSRSFPIEDRTVLGGISFMLQHESYHIGQISLLRRLLGHAPMRYF